MQIVGWGDDVVSRGIARKAKLVSRFSLESTLDQWLCAFVVLIGKLNRFNSSLGRIRINQQSLIALLETRPFKVERNLLCVAKYIRVQLLLLLRLATNELVEGHETLLNDLDNMSFEMLEIGLDSKKISVVIVLLDDLLAKAVVYISLNDIWVIISTDLST